MKSSRAILGKNKAIQEELIGRALGLSEDGAAHVKNGFLLDFSQGFVEFLATLAEHRPLVELEADMRSRNLSSRLPLPEFQAARSLERHCSWALTYWASANHEGTDQRQAQQQINREVALLAGKGSPAI